MGSRSLFVRGAAAVSVTILFGSGAAVSLGGAAAAATSDLPPLTVVQLMPTIPSSSTVEAVDLDNANRVLINVEDGQSSTAYIVSGTSSAKAAEFRAVAFATLGSARQSDIVVGTRGFGANYSAFLAINGVEQEIRQLADFSYSTLVSDVNRSGVVVGQFAKGNLWHAFSVSPLDDDHDGVPDTWYKDEQPANGVNDLFADLGAAHPGASIASAINDDGTVVGIFHSAEGEWLPFGVSGGPGDRPNDISNNNQVVGLNTLTQRALLFPSTVLDDQKTLGNSTAVSVNNHAQVVGTSGSYPGFYYDAAHGLVSLIDRIANVSDRRSFSPTRINDGGVIIANASNRAFLLTPSSPVREG